MTQKLSRGALLAAVCACALGLTACGSTVAQTTTTSSSAADGLGSTGASVPGTTDPSTGGSTGAVDVPTGSSSLPGGSGGSSSSTSGVITTGTTGGGGTTGTTGGGSSTGATTVVGSRKPIKIGILTTSTSNADAFGVSSGNKFSEQDVDQALVDSLNAHGGIGGRKIIPVFGTTDTGSSNSEADFAAVCAKFTTDNHVEAVLGYEFTYFDSFEKCLSKNGIPHLSTGFNVPDRQELAQFPLYTSLDVPTIDRRGLTKLEGAVADRVLTPKSKLGIVSDTCVGTSRSLHDVILPKAKALGLNVARTFEISCSASTTQAVTALQNAELQFASSGIDQIMFHSVTEGPPLLLFAETAESQGYHPSYLMTSLGNLDALRPFLPADQAKKVNGYGWIPTQDVPPSRYPKANAEQTRCLALLRSRGIIPGTGADYSLAYNICEAFFVYQLAYAKAGGSTGSAIGAAVDGLGTSFPSLLNKGGSSFTAGFPDAPRSSQHVIYNAGCTCFTYVGVVRPIPTS